MLRTAAPVAPPAQHSVEANTPLDPDVVRTSLSRSVKDAIAWSVMYGVGASYVLPFIVLSGKGLWHLAALWGLPTFLGALFQAPGANLADALRRRNGIIVGCAVAQALTWLPMCVAVFLPVGVSYWLVLAGFVAFTVTGNFLTPAWSSLMGDLVPPARRGRYFGMRNSLANGVQTASFYAAGLWLTFCEQTPALAVLGLSARNFGFLVLFGVAGAARFVSAWYLSRVYEPDYRPQPSDHFTLLDFVRRAPRAHFGRFVFYCTLMAVGVNAVVPFLGWYFLDQLGFTPAAYATILAASLAANVGTQPLWGRLNDRLGSKAVVAIGGLAMVATPLLLLAATHVWHFVFAMLYDGAAMAAYNIAIANYLYDAVTPGKRARCAAYANLFTAFGLMLGSFLGALVGVSAASLGALARVDQLVPFTGMLLAACVIRLGANALLLGTFSEFRLRRPVFE